uniref:39S ribosomal protein L53, mitochondrial-like n=1 Tax=Ciona intestinalis TaxID=7719 RepID=UPI0002B8D608|nr:39S ribosomal protein L53, mitochondrial-like [Ciona intestinalis]|eukprot:XP_004227561.1 39S ribosomal protein L53, mitochondrial-like [Ciona intestinalis]
MTSQTVVPRFVKAVVGYGRKIAFTRPDLGTVSSIEFKFCPWDKKSLSAKQAWMKICGERVRRSNRFCLIKSNVLHDGSEPMVGITFNDDEKLVIHSENLNCNEIMYHINAFCINKESTKSDLPKALF